jgi:glucuronate isomerase
LLDESTAARIWNKANEQLASPALTTQGILKKFNVTALCTTDDPIDDLRYHESLAASNCATKVYPAFRPDKALTVNQPEGFNAWVDKLEIASNVDITISQAF